MLPVIEKSIATINNCCLTFPEKNMAICIPLLPFHVEQIFILQKGTLRIVAKIDSRRRFICKKGKNVDYLCFVHFSSDYVCKRGCEFYSG